MESDKTKTRSELTGELQNMRQVVDQLRTLEAKHKQIEHKLAASEIRYRRLFEAARDGILILEAETGAITDVNPFLSEMLGYSKEYFLNKQLWEIGFFKDIAASQQAFRELQENGFIRYEDLPLETKGGNSVDVEFVGNVYSADGDQVIRCNIRDITVRKKDEEALIKTKQYLEIKVKKRTAKLSRANIQLRLYAAKVISAHEDERKTVACELHDEIGQSLTSLNLMMSQAGRSPTEKCQAIIKEAQTVITNLMRQVRDMSLNLRPSMLDDLGLLPALLWNIERYTSQTKVKVDFEHSGLDHRFSPDIGITVYRIIQEALTNIARHAKVTEANVHVWADKKAIHLLVKDRGTGFNSSNLNLGKSTGLSGMRERALLLGGSFEIESNPNIGTCLTVEIPLTG